MERKSISSSMIQSIGYEESNSTLEIQFSSGVIWQYYDFPLSMWYEFDSASSQGKFFHEQIKNSFR